MRSSNENISRSRGEVDHSNPPLCKAGSTDAAIMELRRMQEGACWPNVVVYISLSIRSIRIDMYMT